MFIQERFSTVYKIDREIIKQTWKIISATSEHIYLNFQLQLQLYKHQLQLLKFKMTVESMITVQMIKRKKNYKHKSLQLPTFHPHINQMNTLKSVLKPLQALILQVEAARVVVLCISYIYGLNKSIYPFPYLFRIGTHKLVNLGTFLHQQKSWHSLYLQPSRYLLRQQPNHR